VTQLQSRLDSVTDELTAAHSRCNELEKSDTIYASTFDFDMICQNFYKAYSF